MTRTGYLISGALVFALAAAGVLVWTDFFDFLRPPAATSHQAPSSASGSREAQLVNLMSEVATGGGYAATFQPDDTHKWNVDDGHRVERFRFADSGVAFARASSTVPINPDVVHLGMAVYWPPELTNRFNGQKIEIGVVARSAAANPSPSVSVVFATRQAGNSGWKDLSLTPQFELLTFNYEVPRVEQGYQAEPMIVIHADREGQGRAVELLGIVVRLAKK